MPAIKRLEKFVSVSGENKDSDQEYRSYVQEFDRNGSCLREAAFSQTGQAESAAEYEYDENNHLICESKYFDEGEIGEKTIYRLNDDGKATEIETLYADGARSVKKITRSKGSITATIVDEDSALEGMEKVIFNEEGKVVEEFRYDEEEEIAEHAMYEYDPKGRLATRTDFGQGDMFEMKTVFDYDDRGNMTGITQLNHKGQVVGSNRFEHDKNGNQTVSQNNRYLVKNEYDDKGRLVSRETINRVNDLTEEFVEYRYDKNGLLVEERTFTIGEAYQLQPNVFSRSASDFIITRYAYQFYDKSEND